MDKRMIFAASLALGAISLPLAPPVVAAQGAQTQQRYSQETMQQALRFVGQLEVQGQRLMTEAMQVALQIEPQQSLERFRTAHGYFEHVLRTLQNGDPALGLPVPEKSELVDPLEALQQVWNELDTTLENILLSGGVTGTDVILLSGLDNILVDIARQVEEAYAHEFSRTNLTSIAVTTVSLAEHQSMLIERMQTELLLTYYGHDAEMQRRRLAECAGAFERTLDGLITGNASLKLIPPPNAEIKAQLRVTQRIWDEVAPVLERTSQGQTVDREILVQTVHRMEMLYDEMERSVELYLPNAPELLAPPTGDHPADEALPAQS